MKMLFPAPYDVPEMKAKKTAKGSRSGLRRKGASDMSSEDETDSSVAEDSEEEEEEEEGGFPPEGEKRKVRPPRIWRRRRPRGGRAPLQITPHGMSKAVRSKCPGPSLGLPRKYQNPMCLPIPSLSSF